MDIHIYKAHVDSIYDGDTITCTINCGFGMTKQKIRLYGIDCPEMRGSEKEEGRDARDVLRSKILHKDILLKTIKDKKGKYGRYLGIIYMQESDTFININDWLVENNYAEVANY